MNNIKNISQHVLVKTKDGKQIEKIIEGSLQECRDKLDEISGTLVGGSPIRTEDTLFEIITREEFIKKMRF